MLPTHYESSPAFIQCPSACRASQFQKNNNNDNNKNNLKRVVAFSSLSGLAGWKQVDQSGASKRNNICGVISSLRFFDPRRCHNVFSSLSSKHSSGIPPLIALVSDRAACVLGLNWV